MPTAASEEPIARISVDRTKIRLGENITLSALDSRDPDGEIVEYRWVLHGIAPDPAYGSGDNLTIISRHYQEPGNYTIELRVTDDDGLTGEDEVTLSVVLEKYSLLEALAEETDDGIIAVGSGGMTGKGYLQGTA